jgi:hypothetical protein
VDKPQTAAGGSYFDLSRQGSSLSGRKSFILGTARPRHALRVPDRQGILL